MALADYKGPANTPDVFRHLVGATVKACFQVPSVGSQGHDTYIVDDSGCALVFHHATGAYWRASAEDVNAVVSDRRREIRRKIDELNDLYGLPPEPPAR